MNVIPHPEQRQDSGYRWLMLALASLTPMIVFTMPLMSLPVLFSEIAGDLNLSLVQVGVVWASSSLTSMFVGLVGGTISDRFGTRRTLILVCLLTGAFGALRGFSNSYTTFVGSSLLLGLVQPVVPITLYKVIGDWFRKEQFGMASGVVAAGFALGLTLGALTGASVMSPLLGGWRHVLFFYGVAGMLISMMWVIVYPRNDATGKDDSKKAVPLWEGLLHVIRLRDVWLLGVGAMGIRACISGMSGYLPTYLRDIGWQDSSADNALAVFYFFSLIGVIPLSMLSDRLQVRHGILVATALMMTTGVGLLSVADGVLVWIAVAFAGVVFDTFMAIYNVAIMEVEGVGTAYIGTALGFAGLLRNIGGVISPPLGNSLAEYGQSIPFAFWSLMGLAGFAIFLMLALMRGRVPEPGETPTTI